MGMFAMCYMIGFQRIFSSNDRKNLQKEIKY